MTISAKTIHILCQEMGTELTHNCLATKDKVVWREVRKMLDEQAQRARKMSKVLHERSELEWERYIALPDAQNDCHL